ncbi:hypothetical protein [Methylobacter sp.]|uniref:hypothetical protein n=1 Tax=Methylobacter sp. TaxID=2051955 RepID=UPI002FDEA448
MHCDLVVNTLIVPKTISATNIDDFKTQLEALLIESKQQRGIVYIWRTQSDIPRLKGKSPIIYIGKANGSLYDRYINNITHEANEYWNRYHHIISTYGNIYIEIFESKDPPKTENSFLFQYHQQFMELPPINLQSYKYGLL